MVTNARLGYVKGEPTTFIKGHNGRKPRNPCACGCGKIPKKPSSRYVWGHRSIVRTEEEAFAKLVLPRLEKRGECLEFTGYRDDNGYGIIGVGGRAGRLRLVHRVVYTAIKGPIPEGAEVMHECDNPPCCNIAHLRIGTHWENMQDMIKKGRHKYGSKRPSLTSSSATK